VIVVVDHNDELWRRIQQSLAGVRAVQSTQQPGLSGARNTGLAVASASTVAFLDDDAEAEAGWLAALIEPYENPDVVATGGLAVPAWETRRPIWMPEEFDWVVGCSYRGLPTVAAPVRNPLGCAMSVRRELALAAGGFRTDLGRVGSLPTGGEETELSIRLRRLQPDAVVLHVPTARVRHRVPARRATWAYFRSRCFHEGRSKAVLTRVAGSRDSLAAERSYTYRVLPGGVLRGLFSLFRGDWHGPMRAAAIVAGLAITGSGYISGRFAPRLAATDPKPSGSVPL
jgi:glycosyltransferase involved in cell wall biosynthesis